MILNKLYCAIFGHKEILNYAKRRLVRGYKYKSPLEKLNYFTVEVDCTRCTKVVGKSKIDNRNQLKSLN